MPCRVNNDQAWVVHDREASSDPALVKSQDAKLAVAADHAERALRTERGLIETCTDASLRSQLRLRSAQSLHQLAIVYRLRKELKRALDVYPNALLILDELCTVDAAAAVQRQLVLSDYAHDLCTAERWADAKRASMRALSNGRSMGMWDQSQMRPLRTLSQIAMQFKDYDAAERFVHQALEIASHIPTDHSRMEITAHLQKQLEYVGLSRQMAGAMSVGSTDAASTSTAFDLLAADEAVTMPAGAAVPIAPGLCHAPECPLRLLNQRPEKLLFCARLVPRSNVDCPPAHCVEVATVFLQV